jgi:outer membrane biosynthesis protein TonB
MTDRKTPGKPAASQDHSADRPFEERPSGDSLSEKRQAITAQKEQAQQKLDRLEAEAGAAQRELSELAARKEHFKLLEQAVASLEALSESGVADLFWGPDAKSSTQRVEDARARIATFNSEVKRVEVKHQQFVNDAALQQQAQEDLEYDLFQVEQQEESRRQEWQVERDETVLPVRRIAMPWMRGFEEDQRFKRTLAGSTAAALLLGLIIPLIDLPIPEKEELVEVPERFAKLIRQPQKPVPPPVQEQIAEVEPVKPKEVKPEEVVKPQPKREVAVQAKPAPKKNVNAVGILAFRKNLSDLRQNRPSANLGSKARVSNAGDTAVDRPQRNMVTAQGSGSSGGINLADVSRDIGGGGVGLSEGVMLTQAESSIGGGGPDGRPGGTGGFAGRTDEEIQIVFDRYKAALYRLYNRELRKDPTLRGQMVLRLTIEPDGSVSLCRVQSSDMDAPNLAERVVTSVSRFDFGPKDVPPVTILYPIDFLPTA